MTATCPFWGRQTFRWPILHRTIVGVILRAFRARRSLRSTFLQPSRDPHSRPGGNLEDHVENLIVARDGDGASLLLRLLGQSGPDPRAADKAAVRPSALPDGPGKEIVQAQCTKCHALGLIANSGGYTRQGWDDLFSTMVVLPDDQKAQVADYLAKNFPEQPRPPAVVIPGPVNDFDQGVDRADARLAAARSGTGPGRHHLVDRHVRQRAGAIRSQDGRVQGISARRRRRPGRTVWSSTRTATCGSPPTRRATSASSIRRPATSPNTSCRTTSAIRTRRSSRRTACSSSPHRTPTTSAVSIRRPARSRSSRRRRSARTRTAW